MVKHAPDDTVSALPMLDDLFQIALEKRRQVVDLRPGGLSKRFGGKHVPQLVDQFGGQRGEIVDEVQRVLDLVRDAGGELAERGHLLRLDQVGLRGPQFATGRLSAASRAARISSSLRLRSVMSV